MNGLLTRAKLDQVLPRDVIQLTTQQMQAMDELMLALDLSDKEEAAGSQASYPATLPAADLPYY